MTSLKDRLAVYVAHLLGRKNASTDDYEDAQALSALFQQEVMAALPEKSDPLITGLKFHNIDKDAGWNEAIDAMESRLKERLELAPTSQEAEDE